MTDQSPTFRCDCHYKHQQILMDHTREFKENRDDHRDLWNAIKEKLPIKFFVLFIVLICGNLGFQMVIYNKITDVDKKVAVVETKLKSVEGKIENQTRIINSQPGYGGPH